MCLSKFIPKMAKCEKCEIYATNSKNAKCTRAAYREAHSQPRPVGKTEPPEIRAFGHRPEWPWAMRWWFVGVSLIKNTKKAHFWALHATRRPRQHAFVRPFAVLGAETGTGRLTCPSARNPQRASPLLSPWSVSLCGGRIPPKN